MTEQPAADPYLEGIMKKTAGQAEQPAKPTPGPYEIWCEDEQVPGVPCIEIGRGKIPSPEAKSLCLVQSTLDPKTDEFRLTAEDWENARLFAASWETAAERDRLVAALEKIAQIQRDKCENASAEMLFMLLDNKVGIARAVLDEARKT